MARLRTRGERTEEGSLRHGERIYPYLTCLRRLPRNLAWSDAAITALRERQASHAR
ncbi:hypothetical protein [Streptomyces variegatus]|uniref:hypothetical protein n=1 Tax=Streptomyces variegatus TaxID=284040 RepID=UPI003C2CEF8A